MVARIDMRDGDEDVDPMPGQDFLTLREVIIDHR